MTRFFVVFGNKVQNKTHQIRLNKANFVYFMKDMSLMEFQMDGESNVVLIPFLKKIIIIMVSFWMGKKMVKDIRRSMMNILVENSNQTSLMAKDTVFSSTNLHFKVAL